MKTNESAITQANKRIKKRKFRFFVSLAKLIVIITSTIFLTNGKVEISKTLDGVKDLLDVIPSAEESTDTVLTDVDFN
jgi:hypothetical protein